MVYTAGMVNYYSVSMVTYRYCGKGCYVIRKSYFNNDNLKV